MRQIRPNRVGRKKSRVTLLGVISNGSTADARRLLKKYDYPDATDHDDLEYKLTTLYRSIDDKIIIWMRYIYFISNLKYVMIKTSCYLCR
jgi:hypothetical protein